MSLSDHIGPAQFGPAYAAMIESDTHAPGSIDRVLTDQMVRLTEVTEADLYGTYSPTEVADFTDPAIRRLANDITASAEGTEQQLDLLTTFVHNLTQGVEDQPLDEMRFGGTEEQIIERGSDWCTDLARVGCILCQAVGIPARMVMLFNIDQAYSGHVIIEAYRSATWGAIDVSAGIKYVDHYGVPATTWTLMHSPRLISSARRPGGSTSAYADPNQYRAAAISNYSIADRAEYDYTISSINEYYRSILEMSEQGWPGGFRWLHNEDTSSPS